MTTYLAVSVERDERVSRPYCSVTCLFRSDVARHQTVSMEPRYEFDEPCATCGVKIPASA